jgi:hypothetical protein
MANDEERPAFGIYLCPNCGLWGKVTLDRDGFVESYGHVTFDRIDGFDVARFICQKAEAKDADRT